MSHSRRAFLGRLGSLGAGGALVALGLGGCRRIEESIADAALGPEDGGFRAPLGEGIDEIAHLLQRLGFGPRPGDRAVVETLGRDAWIARQLAPESIDDTRCDWHIAGLEPLSAPRAEHYEWTPEQLLVALGQSRILRAVHTKRQLHEVMVELWCDHFNIVVHKGECRWVRFADELEVIRPHAMRRFRDLVRASATSPAMLIYLDGHDNKVIHPGDAPNENYARELLELHTLGVDGGYAQRDVREAARCLSGWTYGHQFWRGKVARVAFDPERHDHGAKEVLGTRIPAGGGADDLERLLDVVCAHPSTARHVARRLCRTFIADPAPPATLDAVAASFRASDGDIRSTLTTLFATPEFGAARGNLLKRPFRFLASALRGTAAETDGGIPLLEALRRMGHAPSEYPTPDGYPLEPEPWIGSLFWRWNLAIRLARGEVRNTSVDAEALVRGAGSLENAVAHLYGRRASDEELVQIVASGEPIATALASPAFQWH